MKKIKKEIRRELRAYRGLVDSYLAAGKLKEALVGAKEANGVLKSAGALALLGRVLACPQVGEAPQPPKERE
jgi:hypothetical protein